jgi:hypothetical protein
VNPRSGFALRGEHEVAAMEPFEAVPLELCWLWGERPEDAPTAPGA